MRDYYVKEYGALGNGINKDTQAIQKTIDVCSKNGGGRVVLSEGIFLTGTIFMKSNTELFIDITATLLGSRDIDDYAANVHRQLYRNESHMDKCLVFSYGVKNISITGRGTINGQGEKFPQVTENGSMGERPMLLRYLNCSNIRLQGLRLRNPASWTNAFINCHDIWVDGIDISSRVNGNGDGLDFDSCHQCPFFSIFLTCIQSI